MGVLAGFEQLLQELGYESIDSLKELVLLFDDEYLVQESQERSFEQFEILAWH